MKTISRLFLGVMAALVVWSVPPAQAQKTAAEVDGKAVHRSVDGSSGTLLRSGTYTMISVVGQPVASQFAGGTLGQLQHRAQAAQQRASLDEAAGVPSAYALSSNYPNPFNPETRIEVAVPEASRVELVVYDVLGREVARLIDGEVAAGRHEVVFDGRGLASGLYVYRMVAGSFSQHRTMLLVK